MLVKQAHKCHDFFLEGEEIPSNSWTSPPRHKQSSLQPEYFYSPINKSVVQLASCTDRKWSSVTWKTQQVSQQKQQYFWVDFFTYSLREAYKCIFTEDFGTLFKKKTHILKIIFLGTTKSSLFSFIINHFLFLYRLTVRQKNLV